MKRYLWAVLIMALVLAGRLPVQAREAPNFVYTSAQAKALVGKKAQGVITALRDRQMNRLAGYVHPNKGLRFSPYVHVNRRDRRFWRSGVRGLGRSAYRYRWGRYDGTGEPIRLAWRDYFFKFVYSRNFAKVGKVGYNRPVQRGNTINNLHTFYPGSIVVEYHTPDLQNPGGLDWQSLWLVFQPRGKNWYLVGIAHDQWTI